MMYLIDSDWIVDHLLGKPAAVQLLDPLFVNGIAISVVTYGEVYLGVENGRDPVTAEQTFERLLAGIDVLPLDGPIVRRFFRLRSQLRAAGRRIEDLDLQIAATAVHYSLVLVTRNRRHFARIPGLQLYP